MPTDLSARPSQAHVESQPDSCFASALHGERGAVEYWLGGDVKRTKLVQRWQPGDRTGNLFYVSSQWRGQRLSRFCSAAEIGSIMRDFVYPIPGEEQQDVFASVAISVYAEHGGHKRVVLGTWSPSGSTPLERFVQDCKSEASGYKVVYPPNESADLAEPED